MTSFVYILFQFACSNEHIALQLILNNNRNCNAMCSLVIISAGKLKQNVKTNDVIKNPSIYLYPTYPREPHSGTAEISP